MNMPGLYFPELVCLGVIGEERGQTWGGLAFCAAEADITPFSPTGEGGGGSREGRHEV